VFIKRFLRDQSAATAIEYCMIAGLISLAIVGGATQIGHIVLGFFQSIAFGN
jgi:pilus assembly protein Flp/PilA